MTKSSDRVREARAKADESIERFRVASEQARETEQQVAENWLAWRERVNQSLTDLAQRLAEVGRRVGEGG